MKKKRKKQICDLSALMIDESSVPMYLARNGLCFQNLLCIDEKGQSHASVPLLLL